MNIEQITQEVVKELMQEMYLGAASSSPAVPYRRVLILLCRSDLPVQPIFVKLGNWKNKAELTVRAPRWAQSLWRGESLSEVQTQFISFDSGKEAKDLVNNCDRVALIGATRTILHKIGRMDRDSLASAVAVEALQRNKPVMMLDDSWESYKSEASKVQDMGVHLGALTDVDRIFPVPPMPIMPSGSARPAAAPSAQNPLPANCTACQDGTCVTHWSERVRRMMEAGAQRVSSALGLHAVPKDLASMIDHTLLKPEATEDQVRKLCAEAAEYHFASVCVNPGYVSLSAQLLKGTGVMVCTVVGFPLGATDSQTKADETRHAIANGADEIDMVINVGALKSRNYQKVEDDIRAVVQASSGKTVKVILETSLLNDEEKVTACKLSEKAGAHFVKTATGFGPGGATEADIALMRRTVRKDMEVKASGSIRDQATALKMIQAGATRIGASASIAIVKGENAGEGKY